MKNFKVLSNNLTQPARSFSKALALKTIAFAACITLILSAITSTANAGNHHRSNQGWDYAKVNSVEPIYHTVSHRIPSQQCHIETVRVEGDRYRSNTGTIVGGIIGAAVGNRLGHKKRNKQVGAIAGAILGASIGSDISANNHRGHQTTVEYRDVERCNTSYETEYEERLIGYNVTYRYHGRNYRTRTDRHPGKRIKVAVSVRPAY